MVRRLGLLFAGAAACSSPPHATTPAPKSDPVSAHPATPGDFASVPLPLPDLLAEGLAWDSKRQRLLVGGIVGQSVVSLRLPAGNPKHFASPPRPWSVFGLDLDPDRGVVWAACSAVPQGRVLPSPVGPAAMVAFSLKDGSVVAEHVLEDGHPHLFGDLVVGPNGVVFATDTLAGGVYAASPGVPGLHEVVPAKTFRSVQGIVAVDPTTLIVADYSSGLHRIELDARGVSRRNELLKTPSGMDLRGIDGLDRRGRSLAAVQNGAQPPRVLRLELSKDSRAVESGRVVTVPDPKDGEPTLATFVEGSLWVMQTDRWDRVFGADGRPRESVDIAAPTLVRIPWPATAP